MTHVVAATVLVFAVAVQGCSSGPGAVQKRAKICPAGTTRPIGLPPSDKSLLPCSNGNAAAQSNRTTQRR
jgi:hypothetical protein